MKSKWNNLVQIIVEVGIMAAAGFVLDALAGAAFRGVFPGGGSISIAMIAVVLMAFRRGFLPALSVGLIMGLLDLAKGPYVIAATPDKVFLQILLDYIIAYPLVSLAAGLKKPFKAETAKKKACLWLALGVLVGGSAKLFSHYLSGILFWADPETFAWGLSNMNPHLYCFLYNFAFTGPSMVLTGLVLVLIYLKAPHLFLSSKKTVAQEETPTRSSRGTTIASGIASCIGIALFITGLVLYIVSYNQSVDEGYGTSHSFDREYLLLWVTGLVLAVLSIVSFFNARKHYLWRLFPWSLIVVASISIAGSLEDIIRLSLKGKPTDPLAITWLCLSVVLLAASIVQLVYLKKKAGNREALTETKDNGN